MRMALFPFSSSLGAVDTDGENGVYKANIVDLLVRDTWMEHTWHPYPMGPLLRRVFSRSLVEEMYYRELSYFIDSIVEGFKPIVNEIDGLEIQRIVDAIYCSAEEGRPIKL